ncbi:ribosome maturation factor RimP [Gammaproteobacteria bacterium SCGC AG-212-F23]|nr:ribosome maturation factor RimP [Gammaproteobacteria bacterium SCGC AG-212-F23]
MADTVLRDRLASIVTGMGFEFVGCELQRQSHSALLRVYIDSATGLTLDHCSQVSRQLSAMLDVEDPIQGRYTLEVSSPGLDRPLFEIAHYQKYIGSDVKVRVKMPINDRRHFTGTLTKVEGTDIHLLVDAEEVILPFSAIDKAKLIVCW